MDIMKTYYTVTALAVVIAVIFIHKSEAITSHGCRTKNSTSLYKTLLRRKAVIDQPCVFPFKLGNNNKTYHACTYDYSHVTAYKPWCSTKVNETGWHVGKNPDGTKNWGICTDGTETEEELSKCPIPPRRCGSPVSTRKKFIDGEADPTATIKQAPWMVSLGSWEIGTFTSWIHECAGSLITENHVLTSAHCFSQVVNYKCAVPETYENCTFGSYKDNTKFARYRMRLGTADLEGIHTDGGIERRVKEIFWHPKYVTGQAYFDVGIAVASKPVSFTSYVRPVCLPYLPVDYENQFKDKFVTLSGWGYTVEARRSDLTELTSNLKLRSLKVEGLEQCEDYFSEAQFEDSKVPIDLRNRFIPFGFKDNFHRGLSCVNHVEGEDFREGPCGQDSGSPVVQRVSGTARDDIYFEQQFIVTGGLDCRLKSTIYTRLTERSILTWIQDITDTSPLVMVVGGYDDKRPALDPTTNRCVKDDEGRCRIRPGLTNDVELLSLSSTQLSGGKFNNLCTKFVSKVFGYAYILGEDDIGTIVENEAELLGLSGYFTKDAAIVCGGVNGDGDKAKCFEWDSNLNQWKTEGYKEGGIKSMAHARSYASAVLNEDGNLWILGGTAEDQASDTTEVYEYAPRGEGIWRKGPQLPPDYRDTGIESHCTVRINAKDVFMGGGFLREYTVQDDYALGPDDSYPDDYYEEYEYEDDGGEYAYEDEGENGVDTKLPEEEDLYADYERERKRRRRRRRRQAESYDVETDYDTTFKGGALQTNKTWLFNGNTWEERTPMSIPRDRPACSIINMPNGEINVLVAGGCDGWCVENPSIKDAEMYNPRTDTWTPVADLPQSLNSARMELLGNRPTIIGGYDTIKNQRNGKLYQYFVETNEWKAHPYVEMRLPRSSHTSFQVPRDFFRC